MTLLPAKYRPALFASTLFASMATAAQPDGSFDTAWTTDGRVSFSVGDGDANLAMSLLQPADGKLLMLGGCDHPDDPAVCMARLLPGPAGGGQLDSTFGVSALGDFIFDDVSAYPRISKPGRHGLMVQADGRILTAGTAGFQTHPGALTNHGVVSRLSSDGIIETRNLGAVNSPATVRDFITASSDDDNSIEAITLTHEGKILIVGSANRKLLAMAPVNREMAIAQLNPDLSFDTSFNSNGIAIVPFDLGGDNADRAYAVTVQPDRKIVIVGSSSSANSGQEATVVRLNSDGTLDSSFASGGQLVFDRFPGRPSDDVFYAVAVDRENRIVVGGYLTDESGANYSIVVRFLANGTLDSDFGDGGSGSEIVVFEGTPSRGEGVHDLLIQPDGKILICGTTVQADARRVFTVARLTASGQLDETFARGGELTGSYLSGTGINDVAESMSLSLVPPRLYVTGSTNDASGSAIRFGAARLILDSIDLIYADGFNPGRIEEK